MRYDTKDTVQELAQELNGKISDLASKIPAQEIYQLRKRLKYSIDSLCNSLEHEKNSNTRIEQLKKVIRTNAFIDECRDYVKLAGELRYADTKDMLQDVNKLAHLVKGYYSKDSSNIS